VTPAEDQRWEVSLDVATTDGHRLDLTLHGTWAAGGGPNVLRSDVDGAVAIRGGDEPARPVTGRIEVELRPALLRGTAGVRRVRLDLEFARHRLTVVDAVGWTHSILRITLPGRLEDRRRARRVEVSINPLQLLAQVFRLNLPR